MTFGSVCSGIEAASVAWLPLGWHCAFMSEIDAFPRAVLAHHYPGTPLHGDFTTIRAGEYEPVDVLVGGTPCQSFSVAGLRKGLEDERGNLALEYLRLADRLRPRWLVWENVPGVLSSAGGRDFGAFLGGLVELGYGFAYRVLDAQYFGLAQRRKRVFVVGYLGDWRRAAAVLFEPASLRGDPAPRRKKGEGVAPTISARPTGGGGLGTDFDCDGGLIARCLNAHPNCCDGESETFATHSLRADGFDASEGGTGRGTPLVPVSNVMTLAIRGRGDSHDLEWREDGTSNAILTPNGGRAGIGVGAVAYTLHGADKTVSTATRTDVAGSVRTKPPGSIENSSTTAVLQSGVRRLTPLECERLQGFPDNYTLIPYRGKPAADGPRYKALGNSMAVPVMAWIGRRIAQQEGSNQ